MIIEALTLIDGRIDRRYIEIEGSRISSISRSRVGSSIRRIEGIVIPGLIEIYSLARDESEIEAMLRAGITDAIVYGYRGSSIIDLGFWSDSISVPPREAYGYIIWNERQIERLYEAYGSVRVAILGIHYLSNELSRKASALGHEPIVISPKFFTRVRSAISIEDLFREDELRMQAFMRINSKEPLITFGRFYEKAAPIILSLILKGYASWNLLKKMQDTRNKLGIRRGLSPGMRANLVVMKKKRGFYRGIETYFEVDKVLIGGELVYDDGSILGRPKIEIIRGRGLNDTKAEILR